MVHACSSSSEPKFVEMVKHVIDIGVPEKLRLSERSIYKVPCNLRGVNKDAYTPECISIGPIHFGKQELETMQEHKLRYLEFFWNRVANEQAMETYKHYLKNKEQEIRQRYSVKFTNIPKEKFVEMMLLDVVFIMELFLRNCELKSQGSKDEQERDDFIMEQFCLASNIARDLILLENQIPFFVLAELYEKVVPDCKCKEEHTSFVDLAFDYFASQMSSVENTTKKENFCGLFRSSKEPCKPESKGSCCKNRNPEHFTDLIRFSYLTTKEKRGQASHVLRTATKLQDSGVYFEKGDEKRKLLDITFEKKQILSLCLCFGRLQCFNYFKARFRIPQLKVDHNTECVFRNLIAFEQCHYPEETYICNYVSLIDSLIHTQLDVELLVEKEVIVHELGSHKEVASLVNGLCKHVVTNSTCYHDTINDLNDHYKNKWYHTMASLRLVYFRDL